MDWCCQTWRDLGEELAELKMSSLDKLVKRGIPRSTFSPVYRILEGLTTFCPLCGSPISTQLSIKSEIKKENGVPSLPKVSSVPATIKCPPCRGTGQVGAGLNCMTCLGTGVLDKSNPMRQKFDPKFAEELAEKMELLNSKILKKTAEIEKNPKPLREDAKPDNWGK
jgi:hypothetical protein